MAGMLIKLMGAPLALLVNAALLLGSTLIVVDFAICGAGWLLVAAAPVNAGGVAAFALVLMTFTMGAVFIFINFLALRQAVTSEPLMGRWLGEHLGLRTALLFAGVVSPVLLAVVGFFALCHF